MDKRLLNKARGALIGLAVGDAVGTTLEFKQPGTFTPITGMQGGGPFHLAAGQWTDDTSMALCMAESLIEQREFVPANHLKKYVQWFRNGHLSSTGDCFDIGNTVANALHHYQKTRNDYCGSTDPHTAGNGSIMRLAPIPLFYHADAALCIERSGLSSCTTHAAEEAVDACRYMGGLLWGALHGHSKQQLLSAMYAPPENYWENYPLTYEIARVAAGSFKEKMPPEIEGSGYVVKSLEAALWAFYHTENYADGLLKAVNLGDDADTTGAVYGQIAGAYYGEEGIPKHWRTKLVMYSLITDYAEKLLQARPD